jgi:hypothetical protein
MSDFKAGDKVLFKPANRWTEGRIIRVIDSMVMIVSPGWQCCVPINDIKLCPAVTRRERIKNQIEQIEDALHVLTLELADLDDD